jgi:MTH538 TIR-like domain (DUF1863)
LAGLFNQHPTLGPSLLALLGQQPIPQKPTLSDLASLLSAPTKRRAFFSFHFDDIMRVNNVRQSWRHQNPGSILVPSFTDSSLWETKQLEAEDSLKTMIRDGVSHTSAVCVLIGSQTWLRRWVKYEIARAVVDNRGLLAVHINGLRHHQRLAPDSYGPNPLDYMAVGQDQSGKFFLFEKSARLLSFSPKQYTWEWRRYADYTQSVSLPAYLKKPLPGYVTPLSANTLLRCFARDGGAKSIGAWIDAAAQMVGR